MAKPRTKPKSQPESTPADEVAAMSFEEAMAEVEAIVEQIESGEIGLEDSLVRYERGAALVRHCRQLLSSAEQRIEELDRQMLPGSGSDAGGDDD